MRRLAEWIAVTGHGLLWLFSLRVASDLPDRIPTHFGISGQPDAWSSQTALSWLTIPMIATAMGAAMLLLTLFLQKRPDMVNAPGKARLQALPAKYRGPASESVREMMALLQVELILIFSMVQRGTWVAATGQSSEGLTLGVMLVAILSSPILLVVIMTRFPAAVEAGWKRARAEGVVEEPGTTRAR